MAGAQAAASQLRGARRGLHPGRRCLRLRPGDADRRRGCQRRALAAYLQAEPKATVRVEGIPTARAADANRALSQRRADAVRDALVPAARLQGRAVGQGADAPVADNGTAEGRARNRRVEMVVAVTEQLARVFTAGLSG